MGDVVVVQVWCEKGAQLYLPRHSRGRKAAGTRPLLPSRNRRCQGSGLGLAIMRKVAKRHHAPVEFWLRPGPPGPQGHGALSTSNESRSQITNPIAEHEAYWSAPERFMINQPLR